MDAMITTASGRELAVNTAEPVDLLLEEALDHLRHNRFLRALTSWWGRTLTILISLGSAYISLALAIGLTSGVLGALSLIIILYLCWYGAFVTRNRAYRTLCPNCTSRMWQLCCAHCHAPVPPLTMLLGGMLLAHCPHCGQRLSSRRETLLAWCSTCTHTIPHPEQFYRKPTHVIVWVSTASSVNRVRNDWALVQALLGVETMYYHHGDTHSASVLCFVTDRFDGALPVAEHLIGQTRLLLIDSDVPGPIATQIRGYFGPRTLNRTVDRAECAAVTAVTKGSGE